MKIEVIPLTNTLLLKEAIYSIYLNLNIACPLDRVSVPSPIAIDMLMVRYGEGQSSHVPVFCVNL